MSGAFAQWWQPGGWGWMARWMDRAASHRVLRSLIAKTADVQTVRWLGHPVWQYPLDAWVIQEVISEHRPDMIIETGTYRGGSAFYYACLCELLNHGTVVTIDVEPYVTIAHPRVTYVTGSSIDHQILERVEALMTQVDARRLLVILDADHRAEHVQRELEAFAPLMSTGSYLHVQDGCIDELPEFRRGRPGPRHAVKRFLRQHPEFVRCRDIEDRYVMTAHPYGWLRRISPR